MKAHKQVAAKVAERPAESATIVAGIIAVLAAFNITLTPTQYELVVAAVALVPAVVTYLRSKGWV
jgi:hypothetical protein